MGSICPPAPPPRLLRIGGWIAEVPGKALFYTDEEVSAAKKVFGVFPVAASRPRSWGPTYGETSADKADTE